MRPRSPIDFTDEASTASANSAGSSSSATGGGKRLRSSISVSNRPSPFSNHPEGTMDAQCISRQLEIVESLMSSPMEVGQTWYLLDLAWWKRFKAASASQVPGRIDNSDLVDTNDLLKQDLEVDKDIQIVPEPVWKSLVRRFGMSEDTHELPRQVVSTSEHSQELIVELYPPTFCLFTLSRSNSAFKMNLRQDPPQLCLSRGELYTTFVNQAKQAMDVSQSTRRFRFWRLQRPLEMRSRKIDYADFFSQEEGVDRELVTEASENSTLMQIGMTTSSDLIVEEHEGDDWSSVKERIRLQPLGNESKEVKRLATLTSQSPPASPKLAFATLKKHGIIGLNNLGNTCYMNSALQCLCHTPELTRYFLAEAYKPELNPSNPLGKDGRVAQAYAALLLKLFPDSTTNTSFAPREFKSVIGRYGPSFSGYGQQDSQEFLSFLLDGLHEDLNRIHKKPYLEKPDSTDEMVNNLLAQADLADKCWNQHKLRNDSCIQDLFGGMYKSTLVCPTCNKFSITFDPFYDLTLPLPIKSLWKHRIHFIPHEGTKKYLDVEIERNTSMAGLKKYVASKMGIHDTTRVWLAEPYKHKFWKHYDDYATVSQSITSGDNVMLFELDRAPNQDVILIPVFSVRDESTKVRHDTKAFGDAFFITLKHDETCSYSTIYGKILAGYRLFSTSDALQSRVISKDHLENVGPAENEQKLRKLFDMKILPSSMSRHSSNEGLVPTGVNGVENTHHTPLSTRIRRSDASNTERIMMDQDAPDAKSQNGRWEVNHLPKALPSPELQDLSDDEDFVGIRPNIAPFQMPGSFRDPSSSSDEDMIPSTPPPDADGMQSDGALIRMGEGIVCYWFRDEYETIFDQHSDDHLTGEDTFRSYDEYEDNEMREARELHVTEAAKTVNLEDCLDEFSKEEVLSQEDLWYCPRCKAHRAATKTFELWKVPDIFVVHFKRFASSRSFRDKISDLIEFPVLNLDLTDRIGERRVRQSDSRAIYDLFAVDNHYGGLGGGHYTAYAKNDYDGKWYYFDDSSVRETEAGNAVSNAAYLLFYRRRSESTLGGPSFQMSLDAGHISESEDLDTVELVKNYVSSPSSTESDQSDSPPSRPYTRLQERKQYESNRFLGTHSNGSGEFGFDLQSKKAASVGFSFGTQQVSEPNDLEMQDSLLK